MLATSATSAVAFLANAISPVPAVRLFGLLLGLLVAMNYVLAVTWLPVSTVAWEKYTLDPWVEWMGSKGGAAHVHKSAPSDPSVALAEAAHSNSIGTVQQRTPRSTRSFSGTGNAAPCKDRVAAANASAAAAGVAGRAGNSTCCGGFLPQGRILWQRFFGWIWCGRIPLVITLMGISALGVWLASRLEPADSLPKLFDDDHNVQKFLDHWTTNFTDGSVFSCPVCLLADSQISLEAEDFGTTDLFSPSGSSSGRSIPSGSPTAPSTTAPSSPLTGPVVNPLPPPSTTPAAAPPILPTPTPPIAVPGATPTAPTATPDATPTVNGVPIPEAPPPPPPPPPFEAPVDTDSPLADVSIDEQRLREERINTNTIAVSLIWGVTKVSRAEGSDAFGTARAGSVQWDADFELGDESVQTAVLAQVCALPFT